MKISRRALVIIVCAVLGVVVVAWLFHRSRELAPGAETAGSRARPSRLRTLATRDAGTLTTSPAEHLDKNGARPDAGTGEAYLDHHFRSFIEAHQAELALTPAEVDRLVADLLEFQEIHAEIVSRLMQETSSDATSFAVHIPPFPAEGKALRELLERRLQADFPNGTAERVREHMGTFVDDSFRGFGITDQTFSVKRSAEIPDSFEITWEARPPEDQTPNGLDPGTTYGGSSGTQLFARDQVRAGEYRFLADLVDRKFPPDPSAQR